MPKEAPCWASNSMDRDRENYIRCSTGPSSQSSDKDRKDACCCGTAFRMRMAKEAERDVGEEIDKMCAPGGKRKKIKIDRDRMRCFTANMICMKLLMPGQEFDCPSMLTMQAKICKGCNPFLCPDRINVNCMPSEPSARFTMLPECLDKALSEGISLSVKYKKKEIGRGCYVMPDYFILRMTTSFEEVVHTAEVELTCKGCTVGICTVRLSMIMRCPNIEDDTSYGDDRTCSSFDESEYSTDSSNPCRGYISDVDQSDESATNCRCGDELGIGGKLLDMAGPYNVYSCDKDDGCINVNAAPGPGYQFSINAQGPLGEGNTNRSCLPIEPPALKQTTITRGRVCPMCKEDVNWLPKVAACPHCGYKPVPVFDEKDYDEKATAENIIVDLFQQPDDSSIASSNCSENTSPENTEEAFDNIVADYKALKQSLKKSGACEEPPKKQRPPNLVTIFSEMQKLFEASSDEAVKTQKIKQICDEACKLSKSTKKRRKKGSASRDSQPCGGPSRKAKGTSKQSRKPPVKSRVYSTIDTNHLSSGHTHCANNTHRVPAHMGWMWTQHPLAQKRGWRPGSIRRSIRELMCYFLKDFPTDSLPLSKYMSYYKQKPGSPTPVTEKTGGLTQEPTLQISKKNNEYIITLRPLKDAMSLQRAVNPYVNMKPVQFRIVKSPMLKQMRDMKRCLKSMGFSKCQCHRPVMECYCRSFIDKKRLVEAVQRQCEKRQMEQCEDELVLTDTTDSESEFDFAVTPPAGLIHPERQKVVNMVSTETQYNENDWAMPTMFPHPPNALVQYGGCVLGERKGRFPWIFGKGYVHQEPKPPKMRNMPKKKQKRGAPSPARQ